MPDGYLCELTQPNWPTSTKLVVFGHRQAGRGQRTFMSSAYMR